MQRSSLARLSVLSAAALLAGLAWQFGARGVQTAAAQTSATKPAELDDDGYDGPMNKVLLKDYDPRSNLVVPEHHPLKAKFPVIDAHIHPRGSSPQDAAELVKLMDEVGIAQAVLLTGATGERFDKMVDSYLKAYPDRFLLYCGMDTHSVDIDAPEFPEKVAAELERCYRKGARGVGEITDKGRGFGVSATVGSGELLPRNKRLHVDDRRLDLFWQKCAELHIPVSLHIADHPSAWQPDDEHQERTPDFQQYNQSRLDVPSHAELISRFQALLDRQPKTTFVAVHFSNLGHDLAQLSLMIDRFPNLNVDLSARAYEFGRQPFTAPPFFAKYKDRILYGSDQEHTAEMWRAWWRVMETRDEFIKGPSWWRLYGLGLPDDVLKAVYHDNAKRILNWTKPTL